VLRAEPRAQRADELYSSRRAIKAARCSAVPTTLTVSPGSRVRSGPGVGDGLVAAHEGDDGGAGPGTHAELADGAAREGAVSLGTSIQSLSIILEARRSRARPSSSPSPSEIGAYISRRTPSENRCTSAAPEALVYEGLPRELEARLKLRLDHLVDAEAAEVLELLLPGRAGHDARVRVEGLRPLDHEPRPHGVGGCQHDHPGRPDLGRLEHGLRRRVAVDEGYPLLPGNLHLVRVHVHDDERLLQALEHPGHEAPDAPEADDDDVVRELPFWKVHRLRRRRGNRLRQRE
jgi:hypothetical protein